MKMRRLFFSLLLVFGGGCIGMGSNGGSSGSRDLDQAVHAVYPALIRVEVVSPSYSEGREIREQAGGSGVIVSPDGYVVTNHHVAGRATSIVCVLPTKEEIPAVRVGTDALTDICVLKLTKKQVYPFVKFGDSSKLRIGDRVLAMGSPGLISQSATAGIVSNTDLVFSSGYGQFLLDGEDVGSLVKWIAHDAPIFGGNSGGPLVDLKGDVVGINELNFGLSGAIPSNVAKPVVDELIKSGSIKRGWMGVVIQPLLHGGGRDHGVLVSGVFPGSPSAEAGLKAGDIILSYNGKPVTARFSEDLPLFNRMICDSPIGSKVTLSIERDGKPMPVAVMVRERAASMDKYEELPEWGMVTTDITPLMATILKRPGTDGVIVANYRPGGPCAEAKPSIESGDIIVSVNGKPVKSTDELIAVTKAIVKDQPEPVPTLVAFERRNEQWLTLVKVGVRPLPDRSPDARRAWLAISTQVLTADLAEAMGLAGATGVRVTDVYPDGNAAKAGMKVGDIITKIDDDRIRASRPEDTDVFPAMVRQHRIGDNVTLTVIRDLKPQPLVVKLASSPKAIREMKQFQSVTFGFSVRELSTDDKRSMKLEELTQGPLVTEVEPGSFASVAGLHVGDIILAIGGHPMTDIAGLKEEMAKIEKAKPERMVLLVKRNIVTAFLESETPWLVGHK